MSDTEKEPTESIDVEGQKAIPLPQKCDQDNIMMILTIITISFSFVMAITGIVIISTDDDANHGCSNIWQLAVLSVVASCLSLADKCVSDKEDKRFQTYFAIAFIILMGFILDAFYNISNECEQHYKDEFPHLWNYFYVIVVIYIVSLSIVGLVICWEFYKWYKEVDSSSFQ